MPSDNTPETKLEGLEFWPRDAVRRLAGKWIDDAAQVVAAASTKSGLDALAAQAGLTPAALQSLVEQTRQTLSASERDMLSRPVDTSKMGLGAEKPVKPK
jgi:hypothetical protein